MLIAITREVGDAMAGEDELTRLRRGDSEAFGAVIARYQHRLYRYLVRLVRDSAVAEDLFQQTWLRVFEKRKSLDPVRRFDTWLFAVAHNVAIDHLRRSRTENLDDAGDPPARGPDPFVQAAARECVEAVALLPAACREVITLRFEEDMKLEEIAAVRGEPLSTVKSRLQRGMARLQKMLVKGGPR